MPRGAIGVQVAAPNAPGLLREIDRMEQLGVAAVWVTSEGADPLTLFAAARGTHHQPRLAGHRYHAGGHAASGGHGTAGSRCRPAGSGPLSARHWNLYPEPGRRLWAGTGTAARPSSRLYPDREGSARKRRDRCGRRRCRRARPSPGPRTSVPVMASGAAPGVSFALCGEVADGAITLGLSVDLRARHGPARAASGRCLGQNPIRRRSSSTPPSVSQPTSKRFVRPSAKGSPSNACACPTTLPCSLKPASLRRERDAGRTP